MAAARREPDGDQHIQSHRGRVQDLLAEFARAMLPRKYAKWIGSHVRRHSSR
jgi:hypothetical protein